MNGSLRNPKMKKKSTVELTLMSAEEAVAAEKLPLSVVLDNVRSLQNVGSVMRTADAFAVAEVVCCGITGVPPHPELSKTALGAEESVAWRHVDDSVAECRRLKEEGWKLCVLEQVHGSIPLDRFRALPDDRYALVLGNEVAGVSQEIVDMADIVLEIPMHGAKHSLNVSVSGGIALWELSTALRGALAGRTS